MKTSAPIFVILLLCSACSSHSPINQEMQTKLQGSWQSTNSPVCEANFHTITFKNKTLEISYDEQGYISASEARKTFVYNILSAEKNLIRVQLENETRLDKKGKPVVWHQNLLEMINTVGAEMIGLTLLVQLLVTNAL